MMSTANAIQIGGDHYRSGYQHWDFCLDIALPYLPAASTKYITRYDKKNGEQDLRKAIHYLEKNIECADSPANFLFWTATQVEGARMGTREPVDLLADFLNATFGEVPEKPSHRRETTVLAALLAREAVYWQALPYVMVASPGRSRLYHDFDDFCTALKKLSVLSIGRVKELTALVYPPKESGDATPEYVNQDR